MAFDPRLETPPPPPPAPKPEDTPGEKQHTVQQGETLHSIADDHHTTPQAIQDANPQIRDPDLLAAGEVLNMPDVTVAPQVRQSVDAVLAPTASAQQKNEAYARVQDHVDQAGGIDAQGVSEKDMPAQAQAVLEKAGLPTIPKEVISAVDKVIPQDANLQQRASAYQAVQEYVDKVGGVNDQGVTAEALPAQAAQVLQEAGQPVALRAEVIRAVDGVLKPDASQADRTAAYNTVQTYVNQVGGVGDAGIEADYLQGKATHLLIDAKNPALKFDPQVIAATNQALDPSANDNDKLRGYQTVQNYVDSVGGVSDQGITADALPAKATELARDAGLPVEKDVKAGATAPQIVATAQAGKAPEERLSILNQGYANADAKTREAILADPKAAQILQDAANTATAPLREGGKNSDGEAVPFLHTVQNLDKLTANMDPELVGALLQRTAGDFKTAAESDTGLPVGIDGTKTFLKVVERAGNGPQAQAAMKALADSGVGFDRNGANLYLMEGGSPAFLAAAGRKDLVVDGVNSFAGTVSGAVDDYSKQTEELAWLVQNHGGSMTPEQLNKAIDQYIKDKGPDWQNKTEDLKKAVVDNGLKLKTQIEALQAAGGYDDTINTLLENPKNQFALTQALGTHPESVTDASLKTFATFVKYGDAGRKIAGEAANAYVKGQVLPGLQGVDPGNPASLKTAEAAMAKLNNSSLATALGVDKTKLSDAVNALKGTLLSGDVDETRATAALKTFDETLDGTKGFEKSTAAGQLFRSIGLAAAGVGLAYSLEKAGKDPSNALNWFKVGSDTLGLSQKTAELLAARGREGVVGSFGVSKIAAGVVGGLGALVDGAFAVKSFADGDVASGLLYTTAAAGGVISAAGSAGLAGSWAGPVGIGLAVVAAVGLSIVSGVKESNKYMTDTSAKFLENAGFKPDVAKALVDQSGEGYSPVPMLEQYARDKGYNLQDPKDRQAWVDWLNNMSPGNLTKLRDAMHRALDDYDGDPGKLSKDTTTPTTEYNVNPSTGQATPRITIFEVRSVGDIDAFLAQRSGINARDVLPRK